MVSSVLLAAAYVIYASGILMPSTKSGRIAPPDFSGDAAASQPGSATTQQLILMAGSKSKAPMLTTLTTKPTLLPGSKAPARLVDVPAAQGAAPATQPVKPVLIHGSKSGRVELVPPHYANETVPNPKP